MILYIWILDASCTTLSICKEIRIFLYIRIHESGNDIGLDRIGMVGKRILLTVDTMDG